MWHATARTSPASVEDRVTANPPPPADLPPPSEKSPDDVLVRYATPDDYTAIAEHFLRCFEAGWPPYPIDCPVGDHVAWKSESDPTAPQSIAVLRDDETMVVSMVIWVRRPLWFRGEERLIVDGCDLSVHPDWRMIRINDLRRTFNREHGFEVYDMTMKLLDAHPATRQMGLRNKAFGNKIVVFWKPNTVPDLIRVPYRNAGWRHALRVVGQAVARAVRRPRLPVFAGHVEPLDRFDDRTDAVWEAAKSQFEFAIARTQDYLNWRYADPRAGRFELRAAVEGDQLIGYSVLKPTDTPALVADILVRPGRLDALGALLQDAARGASDRNVDLHCWMPGHHPYAGTLRALGFYDAGSDPSLRFNPFILTEDDLAFLTEPTTAVHITHGDSDHI
jgi:hypothetical protein